MKQVAVDWMTVRLTRIVNKVENSSQKFKMPKKYSTNLFETWEKCSPGSNKLLLKKIAWKLVQKYPNCENWDISETGNSRTRESKWM